MNDLISVIINVCNGENFITKCLESILNQTYKNIEILIINDGSTDDTLKVCENYEDERIRIITTQNFGLSKSRNIGIENAKGDYLYFVDCDDFIEEDAIEYLYNLTKKYRTLISTCKPKDIYNYDFKVKQKKEKVEVLSSKDMLKKVLLQTERAVTIWNKLIAKELFETIRFEERPINDITVTHKLVLDAGKIAYSNQQKYYYLRHSKSITATKKSDTLRAIDKYNVTLERYNYIKNIYPNFVENEIGLIRIIPILYLEGNDEMLGFLKEKGAFDIYKKLFTIKIFTSKLGKVEKTKLLLFRINPKFCKFVNNILHRVKNTYKI